MPNRIALTGATGFIGGMIAQRLIFGGWQVQALVRPTSIHKCSNKSPIKWILGDLDDLASLRSLVHGADAVVHCAGAVRGFNPMDFERINTGGVARLVQAATEQCPIPRFLLISSLAAREPHLSPYAASKQKGEKALAAISEKMMWSIFRPSAVYGPEDRELFPLFQWMAKGVAPIIGGDENRFSLLYGEDLAEAVICWLHHGARSRCLYELHDGHAGGYAWKEVVRIVSQLHRKPIGRVNIPVSLLRFLSVLNVTAARIAGRAPMLTPGKVRELIHSDWVADNTALMRDTKWAPKVTLAEGLRQTFRLGA
ncbi:MAG: NAD-dependent epimerase/dehydratase family protein [Desulfobacterales bacterium]|jgi:nucleoside-diphosphate-sugar epimerase|nr:NAD-dependent epimerase/dehydratase family protein [Desulfobacterales bacterium]